MKKVIFAAIAVLVMAGPAAADKYTESVDFAVGVMQIGNNVAAATVKSCTPKDANGSWVYKNGFYKARSEYINNEAAGSKIVCGGANTSGMYYSDEGSEFYIAGGKFVRYESNAGANGLRIQIAADNLVLRVADSNGNYIAIQYDRDNPNASRFIDAKLPISLQSNRADKFEGHGVAISSNELIRAINVAYHNDVDGLMLAYASSLLLKPEQRELLVRDFTGPAVAHESDTADLSPSRASAARSAVKNYEAEKAAREEELKGLQTELMKHGMTLSEAERSTKESAFQQRLKEYQEFLKANQ